MASRFSQRHQQDLSRQEKKKKKKNKTHIHRSFQQSKAATQRKQRQIEHLPNLPVNLRYLQTSHKLSILNSTTFRQPSISPFALSSNFLRLFPRIYLPSSPISLRYTDQTYDYTHTHTHSVNPPPNNIIVISTYQLVKLSGPIAPESLGSQIILTLVAIVDLLVTTPTVFTTVHPLRCAVRLTQVTLTLTAS